MIFLLGKVVLYIPINLGITEHLPRTAGAIINADVKPVSFTVAGSKSESVNICWRHRQHRAELCAGTLRSYGESWPPQYHRSRVYSLEWNSHVAQTVLAECSNHHVAIIRSSKRKSTLPCDEDQAHLPTNRKRSEER